MEGLPLTEESLSSIFNYQEGASAGPLPTSHGGSSNEAQKHSSQESGGTRRKLQGLIIPSF